MSTLSGKNSAKWVHRMSTDTIGGPQVNHQVPPYPSAPVGDPYVC